MKGRKLPKNFVPKAKKGAVAATQAMETGRMAPFQKKKKSGSVPMAGMSGASPSGY